MIEPKDSITGLAFYGLGGISGMISLVAMVTGGITPMVGLQALFGSAVLWWMGEVVCLLRKISERGEGELKMPLAGNPSKKAKLDEVARRTFGE
jgi:hypothetical protein